MSGIIYLDGRDINLEIIKEGWAWARIGSIWPDLTLQNILMLRGKQEQKDSVYGSRLTLSHRGSLGKK